MARHEPEAPLVPVLSTGGTDAKHIVPRRPGTRVYGFMPYRRQAGSGELGLIHGHDERIDVDSLGLSVDFWTHIAHTICD